MRGEQERIEYNKRSRKNPDESNQFSHNSKQQDIRGGNTTKSEPNFAHNRCKSVVEIKQEAKSMDASQRIAKQKAYPSGESNSESCD
jgi:hypothetical protein